MGYIYGNRIKSGRKASGLVMRSGVETAAAGGDVLREVWECIDEVPDVIKSCNEAYDALRIKHGFLSGNTYE